MTDPLTTGGAPLERVYALSVDEVAAALDVDVERGLTEEEVAGRRQRYGRNILQSDTKTSIWQMMFHQLRDAFERAGWTLPALLEALVTLPSYRRLAR